MTYWSVRDQVAVNASWAFIRAAEAYAKQTGNPHDFMAYLVGS